jgi:hypothetical protein
VLPKEYSSLSGWLEYDPPKAVDGRLSTSWVEGVTGPGIGEWLRLDFDRKICVVRLGLDVGYDRDDRTFFGNYRVRRVGLSFSDGDTKHIEFKDQRGIQYVELPSIVTASIVIKTEDVYPRSKWDDTCTAEVQVWGREVP